jgi:hypothetical protein
VEEQFYVFYPALFLMLAKLRGRLTLQTRLALALGVIIVSSYWLSIVQTASHPSAAYFSPFTRAWELAIGALVAVSTPWLKQIPTRVATFLTWGGLAAIVVAAFAFTAQTPYPGSLVAVPVVGAALVIAGGVGALRSGAERLLALSPFQWFGRRSYSLYLWHWPILIIAAERVGKFTLPLGENLALVGVALLVSMISYAVVENPIRHLHTPSRKSVILGAGAVIATVALLSTAIAVETSPVRGYVVSPVSSVQALSGELAAAAHIMHVPPGVRPAPTSVGRFWGGNYTDPACAATAEQSSERPCTLGDPTGKSLMVVYGDSHAQMWLPAFATLAKAAHWRLIVLSKDYCPAELVTIVNQPGVGQLNGPDVTCDDWHTWAVHEITMLRPDLLVITQESVYHAPATSTLPPSFFTNEEWQAGLTALLRAVRLPGMRIDLLGNIPVLPQSGPTCVAQHPTDIQRCSQSTGASVVIFNSIERLTANADGARYIDTIPWFCSSRCTAVVGKYEVFMDPLHINAVWAMYLENVLADSLGIPGGSVASAHIAPVVG